MTFHQHDASTTAGLDALERDLSAALAVVQHQRATLCVNCDQPVDLAAPHKILVVNVLAVGGPRPDAPRELYQRPLCPDCEASQPATLLDYVKLDLS